MSRRHNEIDKQVMENANADPMARFKAVTELGENISGIIMDTHAKLNNLSGAFFGEDEVAGRYKIILLRRMRDSLHKESVAILKELKITRLKAKDIE